MKRSFTILSEKQIIFFTPFVDKKKRKSPTHKLNDGSTIDLSCRLSDRSTMRENQPLCLNTNEMKTCVEQLYSMPFIASLHFGCVRLLFGWCWNVSFSLYLFPHQTHVTYNSMPTSFKGSFSHSIFSPSSTYWYLVHTEQPQVSWWLEILPRLHFVKQFHVV